MSTPVATSTKTRYALGSVGTGGFGTLPGLVLSYYLTDTLSVSAGLASLVVTVPKIWDVVIDPFIGRISDRGFASGTSRARGMLAGALTLPLTFTAVFASPLEGVGAAVWVILTFILATTSYSFFQVPYISLPADLAPDYGSRTALLAPRIAVLAVAILLFGAGGPALRDISADEHTGYIVMALVCSLVMCGGMLASITTTRGLVARPNTDRAAGAATTPSHTRPRPVRPHTTDATSSTGAGLRDGLAMLARNRQLRLLLGAYFLQALATGAMLAAAQYVATYTLDNPAALTYLFAALIAPALLVMAPAHWLARRVGKKRALVIATVLFTVATALLMLLLASPGWWLYLCVALAGVAYAGMQLYPLAMLPDVIAQDRKTHPDRAGVISGVWTAGETAGLALGPTLALLVLALTGFISSNAAITPVQPLSASRGVVLIFSALPSVLALASLVPLSRYHLDAKDVDS